MTNKEWLDYLAHNAPDELAAWFDAEHVENQERALDGDTEPENEDSRELILTDLEKKTREWHDYDGNYMRIYSGVAYAQMKELLDRQAAITERECRKPNWDYCETRETLAELTADRDKLQEQLRIGWECECRLQAERDKFKEANDYHAAQYELASEDCDMLQAQVDELKAERERYREKFGKCLDYADAIHALMDDEGMA